MTKEDILQALKNAPLYEEHTLKGEPVMATKLLCAYNDKEAWCFHAIKAGGVYSFTATQMIPKIQPLVNIEDVPDYIDEFNIDWSDNIVENFGGINEAMASYINKN